MIKNIETKNEKGANLVEYAFLIVLIVIVCFVGMNALGTNLSARFDDIATKVAP